jgi:hypothetical protein
MKLKVTEKIFIYTMIVIGVALYQLLKLIPQPGFMLKELEDEPMNVGKSTQESELCYGC